MIPVLSLVDLVAYIKNLNIEDQLCGYNIEYTDIRIFHVESENSICYVEESDIYMHLESYKPGEDITFRDLIKVVEEYILNKGK